MAQPLHQSLYDILEVPRDAAQEDIHKAFLRAKHTYSPDSPALYSVFTKDEADELLRLIEEAYAILGNPRRRKEYDEAVNKTPKQTKPAHLSVVSAQAGSATKAEGLKENFIEKTTQNTNEKSPDKVGRSGFSRYEINDNLEKEISESEVIDGAFIERVRNYKKISVDQVIKATRIGRHYIEAIEANNFKSLPAPVFVRGFIVQISKMLGLPEKKTADGFMKVFKESVEKK